MSANKVTLYITRHGKTMFNTIERVQGWSDTPLTKEGAQVVGYFGEGIKDIPFISAYSSDSGRAIETARIALSKHRDQTITHQTDPRIREWCFGSLEGGYDAELWAVLPRTLSIDENQLPRDTRSLNYEELATAILTVDTANWAEPYEQIKARILGGFTDIARTAAANGGGNVLIVSHGLTIAHFLHLIDPGAPMQPGLLNASVSQVEFLGGVFKIRSVNDTSYIEKGRKNS